MKYSDVALFSDLDGTLFDSQTQVSARNRAAIRRLCDQGGIFGISTGRGPINAKKMLPGVQLNSWSVVLNGAEAFHYANNTIAAATYLEKVTAGALMRWVIQEHPEVNIMLCGEDKLFFPSDPDYENRWFVDAHQPMDIISLEDAAQYPWLKILFCAPRPTLEKIQAHGAQIGAEDVMKSVYTSPVYPEYMPPNVNKGICLHRLRAQPNMQGKTIFAIGDYTNDLELLQEADIAIAVANALPEVKAAADYVICSNDEDAIAYLIDVLIPEM